MNYFLLAETDFFRLINEAGDCNMETAYTAFATQVIELCNGVDSIASHVKEAEASDDLTILLIQYEPGTANS